MLGNAWFGLFFGIGLRLGLLNALLVQRSVESITARGASAQAQMALNSATRLLVITVIGLTIAFVFRPAGFGVVFGMALFQVVLVLSTIVPVARAARSSSFNGTGSRSEGTVRSDD